MQIHKFGYRRIVPAVATDVHSIYGNFNSVPFDAVGVQSYLIHYG